MKIFKKPLGKTLKIIPHVNDTLLLATGLSLVYLVGFDPMQQAWLGYKIIVLFLYIGFGMMALKANGSTSMIGYILATAAFIFLVVTAITKVPLFIG